MLKLKLPLPTDSTEKLEGEMRAPMCACASGKHEESEASVK